MTITSAPTDIARRYFDALAAGDFGVAASLMDPNITWHQPGANQFSGTHQGGEAVGHLIAGMMNATSGTFEIELKGPILLNDDVVAAPVRFTGKRNGETMDLTGLDVLRIADGRIAEARLFTSDQDAEDTFWG